jgi:hypothetical protein
MRPKVSRLDRRHGMRRSRRGQRPRGAGPRRARQMGSGVGSSGWSRPWPRRQGSGPGRNRYGHGSAR